MIAEHLLADSDITNKGEINNIEKKYTNVCISLASTIRSPRTERIPPSIRTSISDDLPFNNTSSTPQRISHRLKIITTNDPEADDKHLSENKNSSFCLATPP